MKLAVLLETTLLVCLGKFIDSCQTEKHFFDSQAYFDQGEILSNAERYRDSLHFYRAAVRLCPENPEYWWKLGLAEWKGKEYTKAIARFNHVQEVSTEIEGSSYEFPPDYREIVANMSQETPPNALELDLFQSLSIISSIPERATVDFSSLGSESGPFVVRNFLNFSSHRQQSTSNTDSRSNNVLQYLLSHHADYSTEFYPQNMLIRPHRVFKKTLMEALEFFDYPEGAYTAVDISEKGTYIQLNLNYRLFHELLNRFAMISMNETTISGDIFGFSHSLIQNVSNYEGRLSYEKDLLDTLNCDDISALKYNIFEMFREKTHWYMMLIGEQGSGMFHHVDNLPVSSWQVQLEGDKVWVICAQFDSKKATDCSQVTLHSGDLLYYPRSYSHQTLCQSTPTISMSGSLIHPNDYEVFTSFLCQECENSVVGYKFHRRFCDLVRCSCNRFATAQEL